MSEPWFTHSQAGLYGGIGGSLIGLWGALVGCLSGWLIPRCRGRGLLLGLLAAGAAVGAVLAAAGVAAVAAGQPVYVCYALGYTGAMLLFFGVGGWFLTRHRYRVVEEHKMASQNLL